MRQEFSKQIALITGLQADLKTVTCVRAMKRSRNSQTWGIGLVMLAICQLHALASASPTIYSDVPPPARCRPSRLRSHRENHPKKLFGRFAPREPLV